MNSNNTNDTTKIYTHNSAPFAKENLFYVELAGEYFGVSDYKIERDYYNSLLIMFIEEGELTVIIDGETFLVGKDDFGFIDCRTPHCYYSKEPISFKWIHIQGNSVFAYSELLSKRFESPVIVNASSIILQEFEILMGLLRGENVLKHSLSATIHRLLATMAESTSVQTKSTEYALSVAEAYLRQNYNKQISITDVADKVDMSIYYFTRQFHKQYGISPYEYLIMQRICNAKKLLLNTNMSTKQISEECGYNHPSTFITAFKSRIGTTPSQFRTNVIKNIGL
ncbi:helix-turn-helix transcriptional regulator [Maledivibacter halophilus]|uniref:AraC-type DNA-binding protein n=1 Tax=Maledivibacter halophilus TaxID=36842 RepID=A0A1T5LMF6_9FIRM|nr:AraC family transcriptional regulator [Maledivibacter halophilus]SKC77126.1 AraC-type DNA-binding protein [Maledivibacter halophilus]